MTSENIRSILTVDSFEEFEAGNTGTGFLLEEGSYDGAIVVGYTINTAEFEGKTRNLVQLIWQVRVEDTVYNLRGNSWTISANEKSKMRIELSKWFDTQEWSKVCDILVNGGILVKHQNGGAHFELDKFIGKRGKLLITEKASKKGSKYNVIASISPAKNKAAFEYGEVPWFLVEGDDIVYAQLADGVKIRRKEEDAKATAAIDPMSPMFGATVAQSVAQPVAQQPVNQYVPPAAPAPQPTFQPLPGTATTAAGNAYATQQAPVFQADSSLDLPF